MSKSWNWKKAYGRLTGNFLISFGTPLSASALITQDWQESIMIAAFTAAVVTVIATGKMLDDWSRTKC